MGGAELAAQAIAAGLVDEVQLFVVPVVIGDGKPWLPKGTRFGLELLGTHRFACGGVFLTYRADGQTGTSPR